MTTTAVKPKPTAVVTKTAAVTNTASKPSAEPIDADKARVAVVAIRAQSATSCYQDGVQSPAHGPKASVDLHFFPR